MLSAAAIEGIQHLNDHINNDTFKGYLHELNVPHAVIAALAVLGIIAYITLPSKNA